MDSKRPLSQITARNIHQQYLQMVEEEEDLFALQAMDGTYYWDIVRKNELVGFHSMRGGGLGTVTFSIIVRIQSEEPRQSSRQRAVA